MFGFDSFIWLLLPLGIALGWAWGRRGSTAPPPSSGSPAESDEGEAPEAAEPDEGFGSPPAGAGRASVELQKLLGAACRERGDVEQAIAIHRQMLGDAGARRDADPGALEYASLELARDYVAAGLLDRARQTLTSSVHQGAMQEATLELMLNVHEQARDWSAALATAERLQSVQGRDLRPVMGHYRCELATAAEAAGDLTRAEQQAQQALAIDARSVRASLLIGDLAEKRADWHGAIHAWARVPRQDKRFVSEVLTRLERACRTSGRWKEFLEFMNEADRNHPGAVSVTLVQARLLSMRGQDTSAYLVRRVSAAPRWGGFLAWLDLRSMWHPEDTELDALRVALRTRLAAGPAYRCTACGLASRMLVWQCPGCKHWGSVVPDDEHA